MVGHSRNILEGEYDAHQGKSRRWTRKKSAPGTHARTPNSRKKPQPGDKDILLSFIIENTNPRFKPGKCERNTLNERKQNSLIEVKGDGDRYASDLFSRADVFRFQPSRWLLRASTVRYDVTFEQRIVICQRKCCGSIRQQPLSHEPCELQLRNRMANDQIFYRRTDRSEWWVLSIDYYLVTTNGDQAGSRRNWWWVSWRWHWHHFPRENSKLGSNQVQVLLYHHSH